MEKNSLLTSIATIAAVAIGSLLLGRSIERFNKEDRSISVKGFAEREVKADLAIWSLRIAVPSDNLIQGSAEIETAKNKIITFLTRNGITPEEVSQKEIQVADRNANEYNTNTLGPRFILSKSIVVRSVNVDNIFKVSQMTDELVRAGVVMSAQPEWQNGGVSFVFTGLNSVKPDMLAEATQNAKKAAEEFCKQSDTSLGKLKRATQGLFTIVDRDDINSAQGDGGYSSGRRDLFKKVRVVVSVEYSIE